MRAPFWSPWVHGEDLIPALRNRSYNWIGNLCFLFKEQDRADFIPFSVAVFILFKLKVSSLVPLSATVHGKNSFHIVNHLCLQLKNIYFFSKYFCWFFFYHHHLLGKNLKSNGDVYISSLSFLQKTHWDSGSLLSIPKSSSAKTP